MKAIVEVDDLSAMKPGLETLIRLKEHYPDFKITCFTPAVGQETVTNKLPDKKRKEWADLIKGYDWIEICPHGLLHMEHEMECNYAEATKIIEACEKSFDKIELPYKKIWRSPYWQTSEAAYQAIRDKGYIAAIDRNQPYPKTEGLKTYVWNKSLEQPIEEHEVSGTVKWHGHVGGDFYNDISQCTASLLTMPEDTEFLTISQYLDEQS